jgi:hypothetical protein
LVVEKKSRRPVFLCHKNDELLSKQKLTLHRESMNSVLLKDKSWKKMNYEKMLMMTFYLKFSFFQERIIS